MTVASLFRFFLKCRLISDFIYRAVTNFYLLYLNNIACLDSSGENVTEALIMEGLVELRRSGIKANE